MVKGAKTLVGDRDLLLSVPAFFFLDPSHPIRWTIEKSSKDLSWSVSIPLGQKRQGGRWERGGRKD